MRNPHVRWLLDRPQYADDDDRPSKSLWFWRFGRFQQSGFRHRGPDLLHAVDELHGGDRRQDQAACRITPARDRGIGLNFIDAAHGKFNAQRLSVKKHAGDRIGESFDELRPINITEGSGLAGRRWITGLSVPGAAAGAEAAAPGLAAPLPFSGGVFCSLAFRALSSALFIACSFSRCAAKSVAQGGTASPLDRVFLIFSFRAMRVCPIGYQLPVSAVRNSGTTPG